MTYLANGDGDTLHVPGDPTATVTFRPWGTLADEKRMARVARELQEREVDDEERGYAFRIARALLMVQSWTLTGHDGEPLPLTAEVLGTGLSRRVAGWIDAEAQRRFDGREAAAEGPFDTRSPQPSTATT